jgi:copper chaperone CopZ
MPMSRTALPLSSEVCGGEYLTVERLLSDVKGVVTALVNPVSEMAYVEYDPSITDPDALFAVLKLAGFVPRDRVAVRRERPSVGAEWSLPPPERGRGS